MPPMSQPEDISWVLPTELVDIPHDEVPAQSPVNNPEEHLIDLTELLKITDSEELPTDLLPQPDHNPLRARRILSKIITEARGKSTQNQTAKALGWSLSKVVRQEAAGQGFSKTDVMALCALHGITNEKLIKYCYEVAWTSRLTQWWSDFNIPQIMVRNVEMEATADALDIYSPSIPDQIQTPAFAAAIQSGMRLRGSRHKAMVEFQAERQDKIVDYGLKPRILLDQSALVRNVGGPTVLHGQLSNIMERIQTGEDIGVIPFQHGAYPSFGSAISIAHFRYFKGDLSKAYQNIGSFFSSSDDPEYTAEVMKHFTQSYDIALKGEKALDFIASIATRVATER